MPVFVYVRLCELCLNMLMYICIKACVQVNICVSRTEFSTISIKFTLPQLALDVIVCVLTIPQALTVS